jgi:hypothetical protein
LVPTLIAQQLFQPKLVDEEEEERHWEQKTRRSSAIERRWTGRPPTSLVAWEALSRCLRRTRGIVAVEAELLADASYEYCSAYRPQSMACSS